jgi:hypothetical protein
MQLWQSCTGYLVQVNSFQTLVSSPVCSYQLSVRPMGLLLVHLVRLCDHVVSISRARFVTAGAIDPKLCTYVLLLGKSNSQTTWGPKPQMCYYSLTNGSIISITTTFQGHSGQNVSPDVLLLFDLEQSNLE